MAQAGSRGLRRSDAPLLDRYSVAEVEPPIVLRSSRVAAFSSSSGVLRPSREHGVDLRHHGGAFSHGGGNPFGRAGANVADREHARPRGLEQQGRAVTG